MTVEIMLINRSMPPGAVIPELPYADVIAAARWLCAAFGFRERLRIGTHRIQLHVGDGSMVVVDRGGADGATTTGRVMVPVADVDAHHAQAIASGATVVSAPATYPFGERQYSVLDVGGHRWTFSQSVADIDPGSWGGELVER
jgi:uncharacterized glyoxalase superfamily protein PhnB